LRAYFGVYMKFELSNYFLTSTVFLKKMTYSVQHIVFTNKRTKERRRSSLPMRPSFLMLPSSCRSPRYFQDSMIHNQNSPAGMTAQCTILTLYKNYSGAFPYGKFNRATIPGYCMYPNNSFGANLVIYLTLTRNFQSVGAFCARWSDPIMLQ